MCYQLNVELTFKKDLCNDSNVDMFPIEPDRSIQEKSKPDQIFRTSLKIDSSLTFVYLQDSLIDHIKRTKDIEINRHSNEKISLYVKSYQKKYNLLNDDCIGDTIKKGEIIFVEIAKYPNTNSPVHNPESLNNVE